MIVVDASVVAKSYLNEAGTDAAIELLTGTERLLAPALIQVEVGAAISGNVRKGNLSAEEGRDRCRQWLRHLDEEIIVMREDRQFLEEAVQLALKYQHPLQDFVYLAAANQYRTTLITADGKFVRKLGSAFSNISMLSGIEFN